MRKASFRLPRITRAMLRVLPGWFWFSLTRSQLAAMTGIGKR